MIWLTWRQFRAPAITGLAVLAAATAYFLITGIPIHHTFDLDQSACSAHGDCDGALSGLRQSHAQLFHLTQLLFLITPGLIGTFWGAPLIARELETGTHQLAWSQTVTRTRWLATKLAFVALAAIATVGLLSYLMTWWAAPLYPISGNRFEAWTFATSDVVPLGHAAFTFAFGTTAGLLIRRTVPAMAVTIAVFIGVQILLPTVVRPDLLSRTTLTFPVDEAAGQSYGVYTQDAGAEIYLDNLPIPPGVWILSSTPIVSSSGQVVGTSAHPACFSSTDEDVSASAGDDAAGVTGCLAGYHLHESVSYLPADDYWPLQWLETGICTAFAAALSGFCFWWIRRRRS